MTREVALPVVVKARIGCHDEGAVTCVMLPLYLSLLSSQRCLRRQNAHSQRGHPGRTVGRTVARRAGTRTFNVRACWDRDQRRRRLEIEATEVLP